MKKIVSILAVFVFVIVMFVELGAASIPTGSISNVVTDDTSISFEYQLNDPDNVVMNTEEYSPTVELFLDGKSVDTQKAEVTEEGTFKAASFSNLDGNEDYVIHVNAPYDLQGFGEPINEAPYTISTKDVKTNKKSASANIHSISDTVPTELGYKNLGIVYDLIDIDDSLLLYAGAAPELIILEGDTVVDKITIKTGVNQYYQFTELKPDTTYTLQITGLVDTDNDGQPDNENDYVLNQHTFKTNNLKLIPEAKIEKTAGNNPSVIGDDFIEVHYNLTDSDVALINEGTRRPKIALFKDGEFLTSYDAQLGTGNVITFENLSDGTYTIEVTGQYDLNEDGIIENEAPFTLTSETFVVGEVVTP